MTPFTILEIQLSVITENLANSFGGTYEVKVEKDEDHYGLNIILDDHKIGMISINGRGLDETKYYNPLLDIMTKYLSDKFI